ncbi:MAG: aminotransferase class I/II-fold pyridoxal phosphate-dependent enzyme, partial [Halomonas sp.]
RRTQRWLARERSGMSQAITELGLDVVPSQACFFLIRPGAEQRAAGISSDMLFERLLHQGILVRHTHNFAGLDGEWLRVALRDRPDNQRFLNVLKKVLHDCLR